MKALRSLDKYYLYMITKSYDDTEVCKNHKEARTDIKMWFAKNQPLVRILCQHDIKVSITVLKNSHMAKTT